MPKRKDASELTERLGLGMSKQLLDQLTESAAKLELPLCGYCRMVLKQHEADVRSNEKSPVSVAVH